MTGEWFWERGLLALVALAAGCLLGLPGGGGAWARVVSGAVSGMLTLALYAGSVWLLADRRLWVLLLVLFASVLLAALGNFLRVVLPIALEVAAMEER